MTIYFILSKSSPIPCPCPCLRPCLCHFYRCPIPYPCPCPCQFNNGATSIYVRHGNYPVDSQSPYKAAQKLTGPLTRESMGKFSWKSRCLSLSNKPIDRHQFQSHVSRWRIPLKTIGTLFQVEMPLLPTTGLILIPITVLLPKNLCLCHMNIIA